MKFNLIKTIADEKQASGMNQLILDLEKENKGIYFIKIMIGQEILTKKLVRID